MFIVQKSGDDEASYGVVCFGSLQLGGCVALSCSVYSSSLLIKPRPRQKNLDLEV